MGSPSARAKQAYEDGQGEAQISDWQRAKTKFEEALQLKPEYYEATYALADAQYQLKDYTKAIRTAERATRLKKDAGEAWELLWRATVMLGRSQFNSKQYNQAIATAERATHLADTVTAVMMRDDVAEAWILLGHTHLCLAQSLPAGAQQQQHCEEAAVAYHHASALDPKNPEIYHWLYHTYAETEDWVMARGICQEWVEVKPEAQAYFYLGVANCHCEIGEEAVAAFSKVEELGWDNPDELQKWLAKALQLVENEHISAFDPPSSEE